MTLENGLDADVRKMRVVSLQCYYRFCIANHVGYVAEIQLNTSLRQIMIIYLSIISFYVSDID